MSTTKQASTQPTKRQKTTDPSKLLNEQDDVLLVVMSFLDYPTLFRIEAVCTYWKNMTVEAIYARLGNRVGMTKEAMFAIMFFLDCKTLVGIERVCTYWKVMAFHTNYKKYGGYDYYGRYGKNHSIAKCFTLAVHNFRDQGIDIGEGVYSPYDSKHLNKH